MYSLITANKTKSLLLVLLFFLFLTGLGYLYDRYFGLGRSGLLFALIFSSFSALLSYFAGDKIALAASGARPISREENPYLYQLVEELASYAKLPLPKIHRINDPTINAFATGRDPKHASIAVTSGAVEKLTKDELKGVLAHELSHIKNYDIRWLMLVMVLVGAVALLSNLAWRVHFFGRGRDRETAPNPLLAMLSLALIMLSPLIAELIKLAVSRRREYLADASGAALAGSSAGLANALEKIGRQGRPLLRASTATAPLFISNPLSPNRLINLFSTHPPLEERIKILLAAA